MSEAVATFVLVYWIIQQAPQPVVEGQAPNLGNIGLGYAGVAFAVIAIGAGLGGSTGYAINPARDLGPRIAYALLPLRGKEDRLGLRMGTHRRTSAGRSSGRSGLLAELLTAVRRVALCRPRVRYRTGSRTGRLAQTPSPELRPGDPAADPRRQVFARPRDIAPDLHDR